MRKFNFGIPHRRDRASHLLKNRRRGAANAGIARSLYRKGPITRRSVLSIRAGQFELRDRSPVAGPPKDKISKQVLTSLADSDATPVMQK
jgi:hypothetical protein